MAGTYGGRMVVTLGGTGFIARANTSPELDPGRQTEMLATGGRYNDAFFFDAAARSMVTVEAPLAPSAVAMLTALGVGATLGDPVDSAIVFGWKTGSGTLGSITFPHAFGNRLTVSGRNNGFVLARGEFINKTAPTAAGSAGTPTAVTTPYQFKEVTATTLVGSTIRLESFEITINQNLILFHGNSGSAFPSEIIPGPLEITGTFGQLFTGTSEFAELLTDCPTIGSMAFGMATTCSGGEGGASNGFAIANAAYTRYRMTQDARQATIEQIEWRAISPDGTTSPVVFS